MKYPYVRRLPKFEYLAPKTVDEAISMLSEHNGEARPIAGGTDLLLKMKRRNLEPPYLVGLRNITGLNRVQYDYEQGLRLGALVTIHTVETSPIIRERVPILSQAASTLGSVQIRNLGTVVGNVCNALPSADMIPSLIVLGAAVKIVGAKGEKSIPVEDFITGLGRTVLAHDEIVVEIQVPCPPPRSGGVYIKHAQRGAKSLGICNVAAFIATEGDVCSDVKICLGTVAETTIRAVKAEQILKGKPFSPELVKEASEMASEEAQPRTSIRGSAEYREEMIRVLTARALNGAKEAIKREN